MQTHKTFETEKLLIFLETCSHFLRFPKFGQPKSGLNERYLEDNDDFVYECCLLPSEVQVPNYNPYVPSKNFGISSNHIFSRTHPMSFEFGKFPIKSLPGSEGNGSNWMDGLRLLWLGKNPSGIKVCNRCGCCTLTHLPPRSAANKAWDQRWLRGCPCGGNWKIPSYLPQPKAVDPDNFLNF